MDALALDQMLPEYQQNYQDALHSHSKPPSPAPPDPAEQEEPDREVLGFSSSGETYEAQIGSGETVPVGGVDEQIDSPPEPSAAEGLSNDGGVMNRGSQNSSSSASSMIHNRSSSESSSFYNPASMSPFINYDRDVPAQKLVALFGRQFDKPEEIASSFQKLVLNMPNTNTPAMKFVPFTLKRKSLLKGSFSSGELLKNDLICMCYNASEARILLTGRDGFYTSLLRHTETTLGPNKVAFLITNYKQTQVMNDEFISPDLKSRLYKQEALRPYLDAGQILSWIDMDSPHDSQVKKLMELTRLDNNPQPQSCILL